MLNDKEIAELFKKLEKSIGLDESQPGPEASGKDLLPKHLIELSDGFNISVDKIRTFSSQQVDLLFTALTFMDEEPLSFEVEQEMLDREQRTKNAGGILNYLESLGNNKSSKLLKRKGR